MLLEEGNGWYEPAIPWLADAEEKEDDGNVEALEVRLPRGPFSSIPAAGLRVTSFDGCMGAFWIVLVAADIVLGRMVGLARPEHALGLVPWWEMAAFCAAMAFCCWRPMPRLVDAAVFLMWGALYGGPLSFLVQVAGRSRWVLVDGPLASMDGSMHFSTAAVHVWVAQNPILSTCSILAYVLFFPVLYGSATIPCLCGHRSASRRFVVGMVIGTLATAALFTFMPAAGPWMTEAMRASNIQTTMTDYLLRLKSGVPMRAEIAHSAIVSFPSEHVIVAVLGTEALGVVRSIRIPVRIVAGLIVISTITTGWHYGVDVVGGLAVAWVSIVLAKRICAVWERWEDRA